MASRLRIHPQVVDDLTDATEWYDSISPALGNRFRKSINEQVYGILVKPSIYGRVSDDSRVSRVPGFPYLIVYRIVGKFVEITGIYHSAADPSKWRKSKR